MVKIILIIITLLLAILGLAEMLHTAKVYIISPKPKSERVLLLYLSGEESLSQLNLLYEDMRWGGEKYALSAVAVDCGLSDGVSEECRAFADGNGIVFVKRAELSQKLFEMSEYGMNI